jgi:hypothetical protein
VRALVISIALVLGLAASSADASEGAPEVERQVEYSRPSKPSGFWGSGQPAKGGAYRWRLLGVGVALLGVTGFGMLRLVKRASKQRSANGS